MQLQKEVKSNLKTAQLYKKCAVPKNAVVKNPKWRPRNGCDVRVKAKILIMTNLGEIGAES